MDYEKEHPGWMLRIQERFGGQQKAWRDYSYDWAARPRRKSDDGMTTRSITAGLSETMGI